MSLVTCEHSHTLVVFHWISWCCSNASHWFRNMENSRRRKIRSLTQTHGHVQCGPKCMFVHSIHEHDWMSVMDCVDGRAWLLQNDFEKNNIDWVVCVLFIRFPFRFGAKTKWKTILHLNFPVLASASVSIDGRTFAQRSECESAHHNHTCSYSYIYRIA